MEAAIPFRLVNSPRVLVWFGFPTSNVELCNKDAFSSMAVSLFGSWVLDLSLKLTKGTRYSAFVVETPLDLNRTHPHWKY